MSANEMFKELGYKMLGSFNPNDNYIIVAWNKEIYDCKTTIYFYADKNLRIVMEDKRGCIYPPIFTLDELQAINKQVEELAAEWTSAL